MKQRVGMIGLGIMGSAMAEALIDANYAVIGYDISARQRQRLKQLGGRVTRSCAEVACSATILITSLPSVAALDSVVADIAAVRPPKSIKNMILIETSTLPIEDKIRAMKHMKSLGATMMDCPISGTAKRLKDGAWTVFASGNATAYKSIKPVLKVFTQNTPFVGAFGIGSKMKFIANHLVAIHNVAVGEAMVFGKKMGVKPRKIWDLFAASPVVGTGVFRLRGKLMVEQKYRPPTMKIEVWQKDMQVIGDMARSVDCPAPLFATCIPIYNAAMAQGLNRHDTAAVFEVLDAMAGGSPTKPKRGEQPP